MTIESLHVGCAATCDLQVTDADIHAFAALSHDTNPLHVDEDAAREFGFPRAVAHGMLALGSISRLIGTELPGPGALWMSQEVQFVGPVLAGDQLTARVEVTRVSKAAQVVVLRTEVFNHASQRAVLVGTATVKVLQRAGADGRDVA